MLPTDPIWIWRKDYICMTLSFSSTLGRLSRLACSAEHRTIGCIIWPDTRFIGCSSITARRSNLQVLGQFVTSLNRMSSEVMRLAFGHEPYPSEAIQSVAPSPRVRLRWVCCVLLVSRMLLGLCRPRPAMPAWYVMTVFRTCGNRQPNSHTYIEHFWIMWIGLI